MFLLPLAILLAAAPRDGLAPLEPGLSQAGSRFDLVLRPQTDGCRFLLSDAETDAPIGGAKLGLKQFSKAGSAPAESTAVAGQYDGHYLASCPPPGEALVVEASGSGAGDLFTFAFPTPSPAPANEPKKASIPVAAGLAALLLAWCLRHRRRALRATLLAFLLVSAGDASAHGVDEAGLPIAPGSELTVGQEIQFALGLRTARVTIASFSAPASLPEAGARSSPSVPRSAIVERDGKKLVFVRLAPERFVAREVTLGWSESAGGLETVAIESGLQPGDLAVVAGAAFLRNGGASAP